MTDLVDDCISQLLKNIRTDESMPKDEIGVLSTEFGRRHIAWKLGHGPKPHVGPGDGVVIKNLETKE